MSAGTAALVQRLGVRPRPATTATPTWDLCAIVAHEDVGGRYRRMVLEAPTIAASAAAGQFVMVTADLPTGAEARPSPLPRPMAVHRRRPDEGLIEIVYGVVGAGTQALSTVPVGSRLTVIGPLGQGFDGGSGRGGVLALARGIGVCAVMSVVEDCVRAGRPVLPVLSGRTAAELIGVGDCAELSVDPWLVTDADGTSDVEALEARLRARGEQALPGLVVVCGSRRLIDLADRLGRAWGAEVQVSVEAHMACGLGYCHGCAVPLGGVEGPLVCQDGPVFDLMPDPTGHA